MNRRAFLIRSLLAAATTAVARFLPMPSGPATGTTEQDVTVFISTVDGRSVHRFRVSRGSMVTLQDPPPKGASVSACWSFGMESA